MLFLSETFVLLQAGDPGNGNRTVSASQDIGNVAEVNQRSVDQQQKH